MLRIFMLTSIISKIKWVIKWVIKKTQKPHKQSFVWLTLVTRTGIERVRFFFSSKISNVY